MKGGHFGVALIGFGLAALSGCATPGGERVAQAQPDYSDNPEVVCETVKRPGSNLSERVCEEKSYREQRQRETQEGHRGVVLRSQNPL